MLKHKSKIIACVAILAVLALAFWYGGGAPGLQGWTAAPPAKVVTAADTTATAATEMPQTTIPQTELGTTHAPETTAGHESATEPAAETTAPATQAETTAALTAAAGEALTAEEKLALAAQIAGQQSSDGVKKGDADYSASHGMALDPSTGKDKYLTDPVPEGKPLPVEPQDATFSDKELTCTLSVRCDTILSNMDWLDREKWELVPEDGVIFAEKTVTFYEGESVFNVLWREMKRAKIHLEFTNTPMYNSAYIEGINNLYEFDAGELSGWMYRVNDWFPNYGCSRYKLEPGDKIEWVYTCNLGVDVGGYYAVGG